MKRGYYWIEFKGDIIKKRTIGHHDGTDNYPWLIIGSEETFEEDEIKILRLIK